MVLPATRTLTISAFTAQPQDITALWLVLTAGGSCGCMTLFCVCPVTCVIMQKNGAGLHTASSCFWDNTTDGLCPFVSFLGLLCIATVVQWVHVHPRVIFPG